MDYQYWLLMVFLIRSVKRSYIYEIVATKLSMISSSITMITIPIDWIFRLCAVGTLLHLISMLMVWLFWLVIGRFNPYTEQFIRRTANFQCSILLYLITIGGLLSGAFNFLSQSVHISILTSLSLFTVLVLAVLLYMSLGLLLAGSLSAMFGEIISYPLTIKFLSEEV
jgi:uncharacterized Tic20 family protein